jgi:hypothetical protein
METAVWCMIHLRRTNASIQLSYTITSHKTNAT